MILPQSVWNSFLPTKSQRGYERKRREASFAIAVELVEPRCSGGQAVAYSRLLQHISHPGGIRLGSMIVCESC